MPLLSHFRSFSFYDVDRAVLEDAPEGALPWEAAFPESVWQKYLLRTRVAHIQYTPDTSRCLFSIIASSGSS